MCPVRLQQDLLDEADVVDGQNAFAGDRDGLSDLARHYAAGQLATMPAFTALFNPNVNSYRRISVAAWTPENATWGIDKRTAALRAITAPARLKW